MTRRAPHPFPVRTVFRDIFLVNFRVDPDSLATLLPLPIRPDLYEGHAFISIVIGRMDRMRPVGVPRFLGINYNQVVYRAVVRVGAERGVHFLRSDADSRIMVMFGNFMSFFRFHRAAIKYSREDSRLQVTLRSDAPGLADIEADYGLSSGDLAPPATSIFDTQSSAQEWLVELFTAFDVNEQRKRMEIVRIDRGQWDIRFVHDDIAKYAYMLSGKPFSNENASLDSIMYVESIPYRWHRLETRPLDETKPTTAP